MTFEENIFNLISPITVAGTYVIFLVLKNYLKIELKHYALINIAIGITLSLLQITIINSDTMQTIISGALSGLCSLLSYKTIEKIIKKEI